MDAHRLFNAGTAAHNVPRGDPARQAVASLRGYAYQALSAALAWIDIDQNARIFLEVAEDYATIADQAIHAVQVKDTEGSGSVTLNSVSVRNAVAAFVDLVEKNPDVQVYLRFFTTSEIGTETAITDRPAGMSGLVYWRKVAGASSTNPLPLRRILESERFPRSVRAFSKTRDDAALRRDLIERIRWDCGKPNFSTLRHELEERLVVVGRDLYHLPADEAHSLADQLVYRVLERSIVPTPQDRFLNRAQLYRTIDAATRRSVPSAALDSLVKVASSLVTSLHQGHEKASSLAAGEISWPIDGTTLPVPHGLIPRASVDSDVADALNHYGAAVLIGTSGVGKSTVARAVAACRTRPFFLLELRHMDPNETRRRLDMVLARLGGLPPSMLILDDLNHLDDNYVLSSVARIVEASRRRDRDILVTCYLRPSPTALSQLHLPQECVVDCPYFTEEEALALVRSNGGDPSTWGRLAYIAGGYGHPQLTHAFVAGMTQREWPVEELAHIVRGGLSTADIDSARDAARRNLIAALPEGARNLLYRLSITTGRFDRPLALSVGNISPPVHQAGECLDRLIGPWLESVGTNQYRVSPLASNFGHDLLHADAKRTVHETIAVEMLQRQSINVGDADTILTHAIAGRSPSSLVTLAQAISMAEPSTVQALSEQLVLFRIFRTSTPIYPDDPFVSSVLRIAQFKLAAATGDAARIRDVATALLEEIRNMPAGQRRQSLETMAIMTILGTLGIANYLDEWVTLLVHFRTMLDESDLLKDILASSNATDGPMRENLFGGLFSIGSASLTSVERLEHVISELDKLDAGVRTLLLTPIDSMFADHSMLINGPWAKYENADDFDAADALARYTRMATKTRLWETRTVALQCSVAQAVILDEFLDNPDDALAILDDSKKVLGADVILSRAFAKIHLRHHDYRRALSIFRSISHTVGGDNPVERAFALRDAAVAAAHCKEWPSAKQWFENAQRAAGNAAIDDMNLMAIGLGADSAAAALEGGDTARALRGLSDAVETLEDIDSRATLRSAYCHHVIRHAVLWAYSRITASEVKIDGRAIELEPGTCSNPSPSAAIRERPLGHVDLARYLLAEAETVADIDVGIVATLRDRLEDGVIPRMEVGLRTRAMERDIDRLDVRRFTDDLQPYLESAVYVMKEDHNVGPSTDFDPLAPARGQIPALDEVIPFDSVGERFAKDAIVAYGIRSTLAGRPAVRNELESALMDQYGDSFPGKRVFDQWNEKDTSLAESDKFVIGSMAMFARRKHVSPEEFWMAGLRFFESIDKSAFKKLLMVRLAKWLSTGWQRILADELFRLTRPRQTVPPIREVLAEPAVTRGFVSKLIVASGDAVGSPLSPEYRGYLDAMAEEEST